MVAGDDASVELAAKTNISAVDYLMYLVSCMYPANNTNKLNPKSIYVLTIHDESTYDDTYTFNPAFGDVRGTDKDNKSFDVAGPYFKVSKVSYTTEKSDAYEIDIGYNTSNIVTSFSIENNENYSLYYETQEKLTANQYVRRLNNKGE